MPRRTHGSGTITARANGRFTAQVRDAAGVRHSLGTFDSRRAAERAIAAAVTNGLPSPPSKLMLGEFLTQTWIPGLSTYVKPTTAANYAQLVRSYVLPHPIASLPLAQLRPDAFRRLFAMLADRGSATGGPLAPKTVQQVDKTLRAALGVAVNDGLLAKNPTPDRRVHVPRSERPWLDADDVRRLVGFARFRDPELEAPIRLAALAGLRRGEVCGLRWSDVDVDAATVRVARNRTVASGRVVETSTKTGTVSAVPIDGSTLACLERHRARRAALIGADVGDDEYVLCRLDGSGTDPNHLTKRFRKLRVAMAADGEPLPPVTFHDLRHSFASGLVADGVSLKVIAEAMRHADVRMVAETYGHLRSSAVRDATEQLALRIDGT